MIARESGCVFIKQISSGDFDRFLNIYILFIEIKSKLKNPRESEDGKRGKSKLLQEVSKEFTHHSSGVLRWDVAERLH